MAYQDRSTAVGFRPLSGRGGGRFGEMIPQQDGVVTGDRTASLARRSAILILDRRSSSSENLEAISFNRWANRNLWKFCKCASHHAILKNSLRAARRIKASDL
jgi:hypothetical protein